MSTHLVGFSRDAVVQLTSAPVFRACSEVRARRVDDAPAVPSGPRFICRTGGPAHSVEECESCSRFRGWNAGDEPGELAVRCQWASRDPVCAVMTDMRALLTVRRETSWTVADALASRHGVHHLPVLSEGKLVGIVSRSDFHPRPSNGALVGALMKPDVLAVRRDATLAEAVAALSTFKVGCLPVVTDGWWLAGILTRGDLLRVGVPAELLALRRCASCGDHHGLGPRAWPGERVRCSACVEADSDAFSLVVLGEPD